MIRANEYYKIEIEVMESRVEEKIELDDGRRCCSTFDRWRLGQLVVVVGGESDGRLGRVRLLVVADDDDDFLLVVRRLVDRLLTHLELLFQFCSCPFPGFGKSV